LADSNGWNIDLLASLADVIPLAKMSTMY